MLMRFLCLFVEHLPTCVETLAAMSGATRPVAVVRVWDDRVLDASPEVLATGIGTGDSRRRVEQLCPQAVIVPAREALYQSHHDQLRSILLGFANAVETSALGELFIECSALARSFPSEEAFAYHLTQQVDQASPLQPVLGIASNKFTAQQAARQAITQSARIVIVPVGSERHFLEPLPLKVLPDPPAEMLRRLYLFGITTLGGFAQLPHAAAVLQFGSDLAFYHDLARSIDPRPLVPQAPPPSVTRTLKLPEPLRDRTMILTAVERLATRIAHRLDEAGYHAMELSLTVQTTDDREQVTGTSVKPSPAEVEKLRRIAAHLLGKLTFTCEVASLTLTAYPLREWQHGARQLSLLDAGAATPPKLAQLRSTIRLLQQRFGETVIRLASLIGPPLPLPIRIGARPDGTPLGLGWGGWSSRVTNIYEYWREQRTWWELPVVRDYYQIEAENGAVFTLFRDENGRWFLDRRRG
jgi:DNA polymerase IV